MHAFGRDAGDLFGQFNGRHMGGLEEQVIERQLLHLLGGGIDQLFAAIADIDAPQAGHAVENLVPFAIPDIDAITLGDYPRAFGV